MPIYEVANNEERHRKNLLSFDDRSNKKYQPVLQTSSASSQNRKPYLNIEDDW